MWGLLARVLNIHCDTRGDKAVAIAVVVLISPLLLGLVGALLGLGFMTFIGVPLGMGYLLVAIPLMIPWETLSLQQQIGIGWGLLVGECAMGFIIYFHTLHFWIKPNRH